MLNAIPSATKDASYYSVVTKVKQKYTVTFNSNGGSAVQSQTVEYGALASKPSDPTFEGHKFIGWATDEDGENSADFTAPITGNVEYFAIWNRYRRRNLSGNSKSYKAINARRKR